VTPEDSLDEGEIHEVLRNHRRRLALEALRESGGSSTVRELSETVAARETGEEPPPRNKRQSVYVSLHQTHLPKLDELGIVAYDGDSKEVTLQQRIEEVEVYMEVVPEYGLSWGEAYFGLSLLGLLGALAVVMEVPGIAAVGLPRLAISYFLLLLCVSGYHVYTHQDRTVVSRLLR
jgi:predicted transcriptional regulator